MTWSGMEPLVFPDSVCLGEVLYVELSLLVLSISCRNDIEKESFCPKSLLLNQLLYAFSSKNVSIQVNHVKFKCSRKYRGMTDTSPLVSKYYCIQQKQVFCDIRLKNVIVLVGLVINKSSTSVSVLSGFKRTADWTLRGAETKPKPKTPT